MKQPATPLLLATLALAAMPAFAGDDCRVPAERWQPLEAVQRMADGQGWKVHRLTTDDGCYELRATDAQGWRVKAKVDPQSLQIVKVTRKQPRRNRP